MSKQRGPYQLKKRAKRQQETRQRIVEATVELHGTVGPARTTISAIAEKAGVQRLTVYRHFPDDDALFAACTSHFAQLHAYPEPMQWKEIGDPEARLRYGLSEVYRYFSGAEQMIANSIRDVASTPAITDAFERFIAHWRVARDVLAEGWDSGQPVPKVRLAAIAHALDFTTWRSFARQHGLDDAQIIDLMVCLVQCAGAGHSPEPDQDEVEQQP